MYTPPGIGKSPLPPPVPVTPDDPLTVISAAARWEGREGEVRVKVR